jgi:hypothetical protein
VPNFAVSCTTCAITIWQGDEAPADGQPIATDYAEKKCDRQDCPHKAAAIAEKRRQRPAIMADLDPFFKQLDALEKRLAALEKGRS